MSPEIKDNDFDSDGMISLRVERPSHATVTTVHDFFFLFCHHVYFSAQIVGGIL